MPTPSRPSAGISARDRVAELAESIRTLGPPYRFHGELMHGALRDGQDNAITWHLIQVLETLEKEIGRPS